ncbi:MAG: hypothetical protein KDK36_11690 [Leptospiraceae bacterium]|nr:hypothetical protein [Leptospiraceae bacterium]
MTDKSFLNLEYKKEGKNFRLQLFFAKDERGIVYRVTTVLYANGWNIEGASIRSLENGQIEDEFLISDSTGREFGEKEKEQIVQEMYLLFKEEISIPSYLIKKGKVAKADKGNESAEIIFESNEELDNTLLRIKTKDRSGLLCDIARMLFLECIDILSVKAKTYKDEVDDTFEIKSEMGHSLDDGMKERLVRNLKNIL